MKLSAILYALTIATGAIASPLQASRDADETPVVEESSTGVQSAPRQETTVGSNSLAPRVDVEIMEPETDSDATVDEEIVVVINDPEFSAKKKLKERINTTSANNVGYGKAIAAAVDAAYTQAKQIKNWDSAREAFTKGMTQGMAARNPDYNRAKAAVCYNKGYTIRDPSNYYGLRSISFSSGLLKTDYDCFYLGNNNAFLYSGDGGFQNLAMNYPAASCTWVRGASLTCS